MEKMLEEVECCKKNKIYSLLICRDSLLTKDD